MCPNLPDVRIYPTLPYLKSSTLPLNHSAGLCSFNSYKSFGCWKSQLDYNQIRPYFCEINSLWNALRLPYANCDCFSSSRMHTRIHRGVTGGPDPHPAPWKITKYVFSSNTGPDPLKNRKATKPALNVGPSSARKRNGVSLAGRWLSAYGGTWILPPIKKKKTLSKLDPLWQNFGTRAWNIDNAVNPEIFARVLFSRNFAYAKFRES